MNQVDTLIWLEMCDIKVVTCAACQFDLEKRQFSKPQWKLGNLVGGCKQCNKVFVTMGKYFTLCQTHLFNFLWYHITKKSTQNQMTSFFVCWMKIARTPSLWNGRPSRCEKTALLWNDVDHNFILRQIKTSQRGRALVEKKRQ